MIAALLVSVLLVQAGSGEAQEPSTETPVPKVKLNPAFWRSAGWREFRWGMGPGDAVERVGGLKTSWLPAGDVHAQRRSADPMLGKLFFELAEPEWGMFAGAELEFGASGLQRVALRHIADGPEYIPEALPHFEKARALLSRKLGAPKCREFIDGSTCEWRSREVRTQLRVEAEYANLAQKRSQWFADVTLEIADPAAPDSDDLRFTVQEVSVHTDPRSWSRVGLLGIRLGMGIGDTRDRLLTEEKRVLCNYFCRKRPGEVHIATTCEVKNLCARVEEHSGLELKDLTFTADGKLSMIQFKAERQSRAEVLGIFDDVKSVIVPLFAGADVSLSSTSMDARTKTTSASGTVIEFRGRWILDVTLMTDDYNPLTKSPEPPPTRERKKQRRGAGATTDI